MTDTIGHTLEEISVEAIKQTIAPRLEAEAVTLLTSAQLQQTGAVSIKGISDMVPNFFMPDYGSRITSTIYVRGIGARMDQPSVGLNVDNVPYLNKDAYDFDLADIASVEMLRGPQSTLYGRNTMAGVINVTTLSPMRFQGWKGMAEGTTRGRFRASAGWYRKFNTKTALSVNAQWNSAPGEFTNGLNGKKLDWEKGGGLRSKFVWYPSPSLSVQNVASAGLLRQGGYPYEWKDNGKIAFNDTAFYRRFTFADGLTIRRRGEKVTFSSITSVQHINDNMTLDQDFLPLDYFTLTQKKRETALTEDILLRAADSGNDYTWLTGLFGFYKHLGMSAPVTFGDVGIAELIEKNRNQSNLSYPISWDSRSFPLNSDFTIPTWGVAAYHESKLQLGNFSLTGGLRIDFEYASLTYHSYCDTGYTIWHIGGECPEFYRHVDIEIDDRGKISRHFITLLPKLAVVYNLPSGSGNLYAKWTRGYKAGGFNTQMFSDVLQQRLMGIMGIGSQYDVDDIVGYKPEQSWNYEAGAHFDFPETRIKLDAALFYIDCRDQQLTVFPDGVTTGRIMTNAGRTRSFGGEVSLAAEVSENLSFNANYGYTNAKFVKFHNGIKDFVGKTLPYAPSHTLFLQGVWQKSISKGSKFVADVNFRGTGPIYWNEENTERQKFYGLLGASFAFETDKLSIELWGKNLTSSRFRTFYFLSMGNEFYQRGKGPEAGLTLRFSI